MPHKIKLEPQSYRGLRPKSRSERLTLVKVAASFCLALGVCSSLWLLQWKWSRTRERNWIHAAATVEQVRKVPIANAGSAYGGGMLYQVEVLVSYDVAGARNQRWIAVRQAPKSVADVQLESLRWNGNKCTVLWNPSNPAQADVELSSPL
jgi:4-amino-4-deoxy-L-arabinose transferase-like glycosyltransferase